MREPILGVRTEVSAPVDAVRGWFLSLKDHPERYAFETHGGFTFEEGGFGEPGARFTTREQFLFVPIELRFELTDVQESTFSFRLLRPAVLEIWGRFEIERAGAERSLLALRIGSETRAGQLFLRFYPVAAVVHRQICGEVRHIKQSIQALSNA